jgi:hypothetical protein
MDIFKKFSIMKYEHYKMLVKVVCYFLKFYLDKVCYFSIVSESPITKSDVYYC